MIRRVSGSDGGVRLINPLWIYQLPVVQFEDRNYVP